VDKGNCLLIIELVLITLWKLLLILRLPEERAIAEIANSTRAILGS